MQIRCIFGCYHQNRNNPSNVFFESGFTVPVLVMIVVIYSIVVVPKQKLEHLKILNCVKRIILIETNWQIKILVLL